MKHSIIEKVKSFHTTILVVVAMLIPIFFNNVIPLDYKIKIYTLSHIIKNIFMFLMPLLLLQIVMQSVIVMKAKGTYLIPCILIMIMTSNFISVMLSYILGISFIPYFSISSGINISSTEDVVKSLYSFDLPELLSIPKAMIAGIIVGLVSGYLPSKNIARYINYCYKFSYVVLEKIFISVIPIYILGTMLNITHKLDFISLIPILGKTIALIVLIQLLYIGFLFFTACRYNLTKTVIAIKSALPAGIVGFLTMSSLVTLPVTLKAAKKNTNNHHVANLTLTLTVNCHDIGECISIPMIALTIIYIITGSFPNFTSYVVFAYVVSLTQFSAVSVPGGSILIMLPLLTNYLSFTDEMGSLLIAVAICTECIGTASNVMGNSAFVVIIDRLYDHLILQKQSNLKVIVEQPVCISTKI